MQNFCHCQRRYKQQDTTNRGDPYQINTREINKVLTERIQQVFEQPETDIRNDEGIEDETWKV